MYRPPPRPTQLPATTRFRSSFVYTPAAGTVLNAGAAQTLSVAFTPADAANYTTATQSVAIAVTKATSVITWSTPADVSYGTTLSATQLNATANVPGSFVYTPATGTVLNAGTGQALKADFTPTNTSNYNTASKTVSINVKKATLTVAANSASSQYSDPLLILSWKFTGFV